MSNCIISNCVNIRNIPLFPFPKNEEKLKEWERKIFPEGTSESSKDAKICIRHFEKKYIEKNNLLNPNAIPTLELTSFSKGNTIDDFEELLQAQKPTMKKKRGSSGLKNLQIAREKRNQRKERMKKIAEMRRVAKSARNSRQSSVEERASEKEPVYDISTDYFLGDREETEHEKVLIGLRLPQNLHDGKTNLKTSSIRNVQSFPLFNSIKHDSTLVDNPVFWDTEAALSFIRIFTPLKKIIKVFEFHEVTGETILNLTKSDLVNYLKLDEKNASVLGEKFEQLRKETIMRYISS